MRSITFACLLICLYALPLNASLSKGPGKVSGRIVEETTSEPIYYATIAIFPNDSSKRPIDGTTSDAKGVFSISGLPFGTYKIEVSFIGYNSLFLKDIVLGASVPEATLGNIKLSGKSLTLKGVTISGERSPIEFKSDKTVYNVENDLTSQGGLASDVLKKIPQISVDVDGNVELQGNSNIRFLINGKPSSMFGNNLADALKAIPASQIKSIEVLTSPGAKYDAQGTGGIINIILKDNKIEGINGNINASVGTRLENGSFNLNVKKGNVGMSTFFSGNTQINSKTKNTSDRIASDTADNKTLLHQDGITSLMRGSYEAGISLEWEISKNDNLTVKFGTDYYGNRNSGIISQEQQTISPAGSLLSNLFNQRNSTTDFGMHSYDWNLDYKKTFAGENHELDISASSSNGMNTLLYRQSQNFLGASLPFSGATSNNPGTESEFQANIDYTQPLPNDAKMETGAELTRQGITSTATLFNYIPAENSYALDPLQSYSLKFHRYVYAGYLSFDYKLFNYIDVKMGGRYERTENSGEFANVNNVRIPPYNTWVPSLNLLHNFKNNNTAKLTYSHRIERPEYRELNPFINSADPHNLITGNPSLLPEIADKVEATYRKLFKSGASVNLTAFYQKNSQDIKQYVTFYPEYLVGNIHYSDVSLTTFANITSEQRSGLSSFISVPVSRITFRSNVSVYQRYVASSLIGGSISGTEYRANMNATYQLPNKMTIEAFGNFNSPRIGLQGKYPSFTSYNFAFRKQFNDGKTSLALTVTNPFNEYVTQKTELSSPQFTLVSIREVPYRSFGINFTYKFGKLEFKKKEEENNNGSGNPFEN
jgi:ferric enterobactin receptor